MILSQRNKLSGCDRCPIMQWAVRGRTRVPREGDSLGRKKEEKGRSGKDKEGWQVFALGLDGTCVCVCAARSHHAWGALVALFNSTFYHWYRRDRTSMKGHFRELRDSLGLGRGRAGFFPALDPQREGCAQTRSLLGASPGHVCLRAGSQEGEKLPGRVRSVSARSYLTTVTIVLPKGVEAGLWVLANKTC